MILDFQTERADLPTGIEQLLSQTAQACADTEGLKFAVSASLRVVGDEEIHAVNLETRGVDRATDVLSFPTVLYPKGTARANVKRVHREYDPDTGACFLGDILLSLPRAREQAREYGHSLRRELCYLTAHAMFHLLGYDHENEEERAVMRAMEEKALAGLAPRDVADDMDSEPVSDSDLYAMARQAMERAYAPYSHFRVGAALLCEDGRVFSGANIENASYGATICAERSAVSGAVCAGATRFQKIAIVGSGAVAWPCGICRQVLSEFALPGMRVLAGKADEPFEERPLSELLPCSFGPNDLEK